MTKFKSFIIHVGMGVSMLWILVFLFLGGVGIIVSPPVGIFLLLLSGLGFYAQSKLSIYYDPTISPQLKNKIKEVSRNALTKADKWRQKQLDDAAAARQIKGRQDEYLNSIRSQCNHDPVVTTVMGGSGWDVTKGEVLLLSCRTESLCLSNIQTEKEIKILFSELVGAEVTGPGTKSSNVGLIGGGFGVEGAVKGILAATVINALTTRSKTNTFLRLATNSTEVMLHISALEPTELRLVLSPAFVQMEANKQIGATHSGRNDVMLSDEIEKLHRMFRDGILTEGEFILAKKGLLTRE